MEKNNDLEGSVPELLCLRKEQGKLIQFSVQCNGEYSKIDCNCCDHCNGNDHGNLPTGDGDKSDGVLNELQKDVLDRLKTLSGNQITVSGTPQNKAAFWLVQTDKAQVPAGSSFLFQRYVIAMLHFMITDGVPNMLEQDSNLDECNWDGIGCNGEGHVISIRFGTCLESRYIHANYFICITADINYLPSTVVLFSRSKRYYWAYSCGIESVT